MEKKYIPHEVICTHIFPKLPAKSLCQFKCVAKSWKSHIENPNFIKFHHDFSSKFESNLSLILTCGSSLYIISNFLDDSSENSLPMPVIVPRSFAANAGLQIIGSYNGLICIGSGKTLNNYFIFNPNMPRNPKILPFAQNVFSRTFGGKSMNFLHGRCLMTSGFGYDIISEAYKLVYIFILTTDRDPQPEGLVYNSKTGSWTRLEPPLFAEPPLNVDRWIFCGELNNSLHFVGQRDRNVILTFDLNEEIWGEINLPCCKLGFEVEKEVYELEDGYEINEVYEVIDSCVTRGCLSVLVIDHGCKYPSFWVWRKYGDANSWMKLFSINLLGKFRVLYYLIDRPIVLLLHESYGVIWYDYDEGIISGAIECKKGVEILDCRVVFAGSLVSAPGIRPRHGLGRQGAGQEAEKNGLTQEKDEVESEESLTMMSLSSKQRKAEKRRLKKIEKMEKNKRIPWPSSSKTQR